MYQRLRLRNPKAAQLAPVPLRGGSYQNSSFLQRGQSPQLDTGCIRSNNEVIERCASERVALELGAENLRFELLFLQNLKATVGKGVSRYHVITKAKVEHGHAHLNNGSGAKTPVGYRRYPSK